MGEVRAIVHIEGPTTRPTRRALIVVLALSALAAGCMKTTGTSTPTTTASIQEEIVVIGERAVTGAGNIVTIHAYVAPVQATRAAKSGMIFSAADVEACAGAHAPKRTGVSRSQFAVETPNQTGWPSVDPVKSPALVNTTLSPKQCVRGWISFQVPANQRPQYVVLLSSNLVKWRIP